LNTASSKTTGRLKSSSTAWAGSARATGARLVGFVNVAWDGGVHAFLLDTMVRAGAARQGIGTELVAVSVAESRAAGYEWLHVDFDDHLREFYFEACGFEPTNAGLIKL
jgi:predicted N-acetyltransferase YhbS